MPDRFRVVITDYLTEATHERAVLGALADIVLLQGKHERDVVARAADADACICFHDMELTAASLPKLTRCKAIVRCGVGVDRIDVAAAGKSGIVVCNVPDYGTEEVADHALLMLLAISRRLVP